MGMSQRVSLFGIEIDSVTMSQAIQCVFGILDRNDRCCRYVVTPNVSQIRRLQKDNQFKHVYDHAELVLADGMPLILSSRLFGVPLPERVSGIDFTGALFEAAGKNGKLTCFLMGAGPGVAERAAYNIEKRWPEVKVTGCYSPPWGFENDEEQNKKILKMISSVNPDVLLVCLGAPKQELWVYRHLHELEAKVALCVGATIDFLAGEKKRAPVWMQKIGLEWLYRFITEPKRLAKRYICDALIFPPLLWKEWRKRTKS